MVNLRYPIGKHACLCAAFAFPLFAAAQSVDTLDTPTSDGARYGAVTTTTEGHVVLSWLTKSDATASLLTATWDGHWSEPTLIASGENWFVNWADFPSIATSSNEWFAHWLEKSGDSTYAYGIRLAISTDKGTTWSDPQWLHDDRTPTEHGFVDYAVSPDGYVIASWLDGANTANRGPMMLRMADLSVHGPQNEMLLDDRVCDCCQTTAAWTQDGPIVVYRDRTESEIRDIYYTRRVDGAWTTPVAIADDHWEIAGCPVNGPAVTADEEHVAVVWFTGAQDHSRVRAALSTDSGASFGDPLEITSDTSGRVDATWTPAGNLALTYVTAARDDSELVLMLLDPAGKELARKTIATLTASRATGFPRITSTPEALYIVWTAIDAGVSTLRMAKVGL